MWRLEKKRLFLFECLPFTPQVRFQNLDQVLLLTKTDVNPASPPRKPESTYALGLPWGAGWVHIRLSEQEDLIKILEPYLRSEWKAFKQEKPFLLQAPHTLS